MSSGDASRVVSGPEETPGGSDRWRSSTLLIVLGAGFTIVGLVDLLLLWIPARFDSVAWEFATVGRTLDGLPMPALGLGLMALGGIRRSRDRSRWRRGFAIVFGSVAVLLVMVAALFATSAPAVLGNTPPEAMGALRRAVLRHSVQSVVYPVMFATLAVQVWRGRRS